MTEMFRDKIDVSVTVNGEPVEARVPAGQHMIDFLRLELGLTGAHASCEHGVCGACTIRVDGDAVRGCLMLAAQADGAEVWTVEGLTDTNAISDLQDAFVARQRSCCPKATFQAVRKFVNTCLAITAAARGTRRSSTLSRASRKAALERAKHDHSIQQSRPTQFLYRKDSAASECRQAGARSWPLCR